MFKVIIAGGREFQDYNLLKAKCDRILYGRRGHDIQIVSGKAPGADTLGERYAKANGYPIKECPAEWDNFDEPCVIRYRKNGTKYNALAGIKRNTQMALYSDALIAFWDGKSTGTKDMIKQAYNYRLKSRTINY